MLSSKRGFLLLEVCLGILLSVLISSTLAYWHMKVLNANQYFTKRNQALCLARSLLEEFTVSQKVPRTWKDYNLQWQITPTRLPSFKQVVVTVTWKRGRVEESVRLATGILC